MKQYLPVLFTLSLGLSLINSNAIAALQSDLIGTDICPAAATGNNSSGCANLSCPQYYYYCNANNPATGVFAGSLAGLAQANADMSNSGITNPPASSVSRAAPMGSSLSSPMGWGNAPAANAQGPISAPPPAPNPGISAAPYGQQSLPKIKFQ